MEIKDEYLNLLIDIVTSKTGIIPRDSHRAGIKSYVEKRMKFLNLNTIFDYMEFIKFDTEEFANLVNESTINETYFFREEKQFIILRDKIFPLWLSKTGGASINVWCAACSSGEEAYSLALLSQSCHIRANITASDINTKVLDICKKGIYKSSSCRTVDGGFFNNLLKPLIDEDNRFVMTNDIREMITPVQLNLAKLDSIEYLSRIPKNQNIVFIRNVFIYFSMDLRKQILQTIVDKTMADDSYLFVSMNEIAPLDDKIIPSSLEKIVDGDVFYFHKKVNK